LTSLAILTEELTKSVIWKVELVTYEKGEGEVKVLEEKTVLARGVLIGFCLACAFFAVLQTKSSTGNTYDTWADLNDDGYINIVDVASVASAFGSEGDPSKLANATNLWELDCYYHLSVESVIDRRHAAAGNREPVTCFILVSYGGVPVSNLTNGNFSTGVISTPFDFSVEFTFTFEEEVGNGTGVYVFAIQPSMPAATAWEDGTYVFIVNVYAKAVAILNISPKSTTSNEAKGINAPNLVI
jgi:hypothetical protein